MGRACGGARAPRLGSRPRREDDLEADPRGALLDDLADRLVRTVPQFADTPFHRVLACRVPAVTGWAAAEG